MRGHIYRPSNGNELRSALIFIHSGGFYGGDLKLVENACKVPAEKATVIVISGNREPPAF